MKNCIEQLRTQMDITQEELSKLTDISVKELTAIENNQIDPSLIDAHKITKALKQEFIASVFVLE